MIWTEDYEPITSKYRLCLTETENATLDRAIEYAKGFFPYAEADDLIVIRVEDYNCIAVINDHFTPIEIWHEVVPFDSEKVYPLQGIEQKICFKTF